MKAAAVVTWEWLRGFRPARMRVNGRERLRAACGAMFGIFLTALVSRAVPGSSAALPLLIAPVGASAVLLFAAPNSPLAQPWSVLGGNMVSAAVGVTCVWLLGDSSLAAAAAVAAALGLMFTLRCLHPPGGAIALSAVLGGPAIQAQGYHYVWLPVGLNSLLLLLVALAFNNATRRRYPHPPQLEHRNLHKTADVPPGSRLGFTSADLDAVLTRYNQVVDVSQDELESLFLQTEMQAYRRRSGDITCADIMSRAVITAEPDMPLEQAWKLLRRHRIKSLPVVDGEFRVVGIVTQGDFLERADLDLYRSPGQGLRQSLVRLLRRYCLPGAGRRHVVDRIMTSPVHTAAAAMHIVELVPLMSDAGLRQIPIVDAEGRIAGMVTQSDLVAALYRAAGTQRPLPDVHLSEAPPIPHEDEVCAKQPR
ncbi:MAG: HPP family protein [Noviherbaspirillum sp.]